jgi:hypothetical protein
MFNVSVDVKLLPPTTALDEPVPDVVNALSSKLTGTALRPKTSLPEFVPDPKTTVIPDPTTPPAAATTLPSSIASDPTNGD